MSNQTQPDNIKLYAEHDFEFQISLERAFAQLETDDSNLLLLDCLKTLTLISQNKSITEIAAQLKKTDDETQVYLSECRQRLMQYPPIQWCLEKYNATSMNPDKEEPNWIQLLAGQTVPNVIPNRVRETQIFRAALLSHSDKPKNATEIPYPHILDNVLARLEAEQLLPPRQKQSWFEKGRLKFTLFFRWLFSVKSQWYYKHGVAVALLVLVVIFIIPLPPYHEPTIPEDSIESDGFKSSIRGHGTEETSRSKGAEPCVNELFEVPQAIASQLQQELKNLGITASVSQTDNVWRLETTLPADKSPALKDWLKRYDFIVLPGSHYLCIDVSSEEDIE